MFCSSAKPSTFMTGTIEGVNPVYATAGAITLAVVIILAFAVRFTRAQSDALRAEQANRDATKRAADATAAMGR